jgi:hypothetical protein
MDKIEGEQPNCHFTINEGDQMLLVLHNIWTKFHAWQINPLHPHIMQEE